MTQDSDSYARAAAALERLTRRHGGEPYRRLNSYGGPYLAASPLEVVALLGKAVGREEEGGVTGQDLDDVLLMLGRARDELHHYELEMVDRGSGDRRTAQTRYSRLRERTPDHTPPTAQEAVSA
ncbi:hypothetical protein [Streptomyces sp. NPDC058548]|uniref:hypothetical protein n=1 Tax=Streptomyces sp. NPDC058548 TaxID=3346545 RepID=UPI00364639CB